ncbi:hypothetical protein BG011_004498 [Mortierella polycephala]|uniref:UBC core domain-containing protein n=1 Tax=Mortierella polycephala TaxID=41804 RepID=A0A9P6PYC0_9FUNG|nr:hypothetical protein BG011_004498 [Mortierella polycephala]
MASLPSIPAQYNKKSSAVKRIMQEARELVREPSTDFAANPLETDIFEWHFTIRGPEETDFEGGLYHGRILLPNNYPFAPPSLMFLTPNGRFELHKKVCLSITGYHPEYWQPAWGIRTVLVAVMGFLPTQSKGAIGGLDTSVAARKTLAIKSRTWMCPTCNLENVAILPDVAPENVVKASLKADEMPPEFSFGYEADKKKQQEDSDAKEMDDSSTVSGNNNGSPNNNDKETPQESLADEIALQNPVPSSSAVSTSNHGNSHAGVERTTEDKEPHLQQRSPSTATPTLTPSSTLQDPSRAAIATRTQGQPAQVQRTGSNIPVWLDVLILGFGGLLLAMIIRRFM